MARGRSFSPIEEQLIRENYDKTIAELEEILLDNGYKRSRKSINRKLEKLRDEGVVGFRSRETIRRSYRQRTRRPHNVEPTKLEDSFDTGEGDFDTGVDWDDV